VSDIKKIKEKSVDYFNNCGTYAERNSAFDELTANLGDNVAPKEGFAPDDWRFIGVQGLRPLMVKFFCKIQAIAEERLELEELEKRPKYGARALKAERIVDGNRGRWGLVWNGEDVVEKVTHSMDFLRKCKEFCNWYALTHSLTHSPTTHLLTHLLTQVWSPLLLPGQPADAPVRHADGAQGAEYGVQSQRAAGYSTVSTGWDRRQGRD